MAVRVRACVQCDALDGGTTVAVACGMGYTMFLLDPAHPKLDKLKVFESKALEAAAPAGALRVPALPALMDGCA